MTKTLPKIAFKTGVELEIEVFPFSELYQRLLTMKTHDPFSAHKIQFYLILMVTGSGYSHYIDFKSYDLEKGSLVFIAKNQVHHFTKSLQHTQGFCIVLHSQFLEAQYFLSTTVKLNRVYNYHLESPVITPKEIGDEELIETVQQLYKEYTLATTFAKAALLQTYVQILLLKAERIKQQQAVQEIKSYWLSLFSTFKNILEENYVNTRNSRFYAKELGVSYKFLNTIVKKATEKTVKAFVDDFVSMEIKRYLISTSLSIKEISYKTGFEEPANMTKFFKRNTQITPLQYRKQRKQ